MSFNPDPSKQAVEVYFSRWLVHANAPVLLARHLGLTLGSKLSFNHHLDGKIKNNNAFFYKNTLYKNLFDEIYQKVKNVLKNTFIIHFC